MEYLATVSDGIATTIGVTTSLTTPGDGSLTIDPPTNYIAVGGGYWINGFFYPYGIPYPQPVVVPYPVVTTPLVLPAPDLELDEKLALEVLKLGAKVPKGLRDKALKVIGARLGGPDDEHSGSVQSRSRGPKTSNGNRTRARRRR